MPTWGQVLAELNATLTPAGVPDYDGVRRKYLAELYALTGRNAVVYAADWLSPGAHGAGVSVTLGDMQGLMEVFKDLQGPSLDLILNSPGGDPTAAASLVGYMRSKYDDVRVFVPLAAMSAATMWALSGDRLVMGKHSQLGPIDPQLQLPQGMVPAAALRRQFETAQRECSRDPARLSAWLPTLQQYFPGLLEICADAEELGRKIVEEWLATYMFRGQRNRKSKAKRIAEFLSDSANHGSHSVGIRRDRLRSLGVVVEDLEDDPALQDAVLTVHHAVMHTLSGTAAVKLIENHLGRAYVNQQQTISVPFPQGVMPIPAPPAEQVTSCAANGAPSP